MCSVKAFDVYFTITAACHAVHVCMHIDWNADASLHNQGDALPFECHATDSWAVHVYQQCTAAKSDKYGINCLINR